MCEEMYRMYKKRCTKKGIETQKSFDFYCKTFQTHSNLKRHKSKKDVCNLCTGYENTFPQTRSNEQALAYKQHQAEKKSAREYKAQLKVVGKKRKVLQRQLLIFEKRCYAPVAKLHPLTIRNDFEITILPLPT